MVKILQTIFSPTLFQNYQLSFFWLLWCIKLAPILLEKSLRKTNSCTIFIMDSKHASIPVKYVVTKKKKKTVLLRDNLWTYADFVWYFEKNVLENLLYYRCMVVSTKSHIYSPKTTKELVFLKLPDGTEIRFSFISYVSFRN